MLSRCSAISHHDRTVSCHSADFCFRMYYGFTAMGILSYRKRPVSDLPIATIIVQILPQIYPYLRVFDSLGLCRQPAKTILAMVFLNGMYLFMIPSGVGLYCFASGMFQAMEQLILNMISVRKMKTQEAF